MKLINGLFAIFAAITLSACANPPCDEAALKKYSKLLAQKIPLLVDLEIEKKAVVFTKLSELNKMKHVPKEQLCLLVKELLDEVGTALG